MAITQLGLYNGALRHCKERSLGSLTEAVEAARLLNAVWNDDFIQRVLEQADWQFAQVSVKLDADPDVDVSFGYRNAFNKPDDLVRMSMISADEYFRDPLTQYRPEGKLWYADLDWLYISYVSNDPEFGGDITNWTRAVADYAAAELAWRVVGKLSQDAALQKEVMDIRDMALSHAKGIDGIQKPTVFPPQGAWSKARLSGRRGGRPGRWGGI